MEDTQWFEQIAAATSADEGDAAAPAPARLKARIYSALVSSLAATGPLLSLRATKSAGRGLCVFEHMVAAPLVGERVNAMNPCRVCHARVLAEHLDRAPIFWPNCPYAEFHRKQS